ncbi:uncharacterized protein LOC136081122 [Hydra vulgaris]|uniref:Uncharacterized protein LOC136081122 n=1 Tax=Hydra vulgaris TaxID=6087 RepID=A0ABM4BZ03_HYDVU
MEKRKFKRGAQKEREKRQKIMQEAAKNTLKLSDMFASTSLINAFDIENLNKDLDLSSSVSRNDDTIMCPIGAGKVKTSILEEITSVSTSTQANNEMITPTNKMFNFLSDNYFIRPGNKNYEEFFKKHPCQPTIDDITNLPFKPNLLFYREDKVNRRWLSYSLEKNALFCTMCLAYSDITNESSFVNRGMTDWRHTLQRVKEHENSKTHESCVNCHMLKSKGKAFRAHRSESVSSLSLENNQEDPGIFLETILLLSNYDAVLKLHLSRVIKEKKKNNETSAGTKDSVLLDIQEAGTFSLQINTTQDITQKDQCSIVVRYVKGNIYERVIAVLNCKSSTGKDMCSLISTFIKNSGLHIKNCIGNSTDGAANMRGQYNGFTSWLSKESPGQIHDWCYAHVLNLVVTDATSSVIEGTSLFQLLNSCAVFLRESYQRMDVWENTSLKIRYQRLNVIGETRWSAKETALKNLGIMITKKPLYVDLLITLNYFVSNESFNAQIRHAASTLMESLLKFKVILYSAYLFKIFSIYWTVI